VIIKVRGYLTYREVIGRQKIEQPDDIPVTLLDLIRGIAGEIPGEPGQALFDNETGAIGQSVAIMLNGVHYHHLPDRLKTVLKDQDEIAIFPPAAGG
jgi:molybdopterin converting factor small subunit